ncbi:MAG: Nucleotidyl transferase [Pseudonocardiales bacterium]|jgi:molybdopterin-guanine dinucleotide biosynthesis protein A|nr:Nucleotidyl transferase [Pseudonocardiales bacterium]
MIIPAAGRASRMNPDPDAPPKCLLEIDGRLLLDRLLPSTPTAVERCRIVVPPDNADFAKWAAGYDGTLPCELVEAPLEPFGHTVLRAAGDASEVLISDSDLVVADGALERFIASARRNAGGTDLTLALTIEPWDIGPRTIWWSVTEEGARVERGLDHPQARLAGLYCLRGPALSALRRYCAAGGRSFAEFLATFPRSRIDGVDVGFAFDCNDPEQLAAARARVSCP